MNNQKKLPEVICPGCGWDPCRCQNTKGSGASPCSPLSETPETDEQTFTFAVAQVNIPPADYKLVRAGFARQLERERDEARREATDYRDADAEAHGVAPTPLPWENSNIKESSDSYNKAKGV